MSERCPAHGSEVCNELWGVKLCAACLEQLNEWTRERAAADVTGEFYCKESGCAEPIGRGRRNLTPWGPHCFEHGFPDWADFKEREFTRNEMQAEKQAAKEARRRRNMERPCQDCGGEVPRTLRTQTRRRCDACTDLHAQHGQRAAKYGMTVPQLIGFLENARCAICGPDSPVIGFDAHIDHDHACCPGQGSCGKCVRGPLCSRHNTALGTFQDNIDALKRAIEYLSR